MSIPIPATETKPRNDTGNTPNMGASPGQSHEIRTDLKRCSRESLLDPAAFQGETLTAFYSAKFFLYTVQRCLAINYEVMIQITTHLIRYTAGDIHFGID